MIPVILIFGMRDFCLWGTTSLTPVMTQIKFSFTEETSGLLIGLMSLTGVISQPLGGFLSDMIGRRRVIFVTLLLGGLSVLFYPYAGGVTLFPVSLLTGFMLLGTVPVIDATAAEIMPPAVRGRMFGMMMTLGIMFGAVSPYFTGLMVDFMGELLIEEIPEAYFTRLIIYDKNISENTDIFPLYHPDYYLFIEYRRL